MLGIEETTYLQETDPERGIGRIGNVQPQTFGELAQHVKQVFGLDSLRLVHYQESDLQKPLSRVAICGGSGSHSIRMLWQKGQMSISLVIFITILLRICCLMVCWHWTQVTISSAFCGKIAELLNQWKGEKGWTIDIVPSQASTNPFHHI